jgi:hypothetical protein
MKAPVSHSKDPDLQKAPQALMRASEKARQLAELKGRTKGVVFEYFFETVLLGYTFNLNYSINPLSR